MKNVTIYTDGACKRNGNGGYGVVLIHRSGDDKEYMKELSGGYKNTTNNRMELLGAIKGLEALNTECDVDLYSDSKYLVDAFNQNWINRWIVNNWRSTGGKVKNKDLWEQLIHLTNIHNVTFHWVKGHNNNLFNDRCDKLAVAASKSDALLKDEGGK